MSRNTANWVYVLENDFSWRSNFEFTQDRDFHSADGVVRLTIKKNGTMTVTKGYAWDGCSPTFRFFDLLIGVPDGATDARTGFPKTYYASLIHDALCQFFDAGLGLTWTQVSQCFLALLTEADFAPRKVYYYGVQFYGHLLV